MKTVRGFTLLELTVVVSIIVALAAVVIPMVGDAKRDSEVAQILQMVDTLRTGVQHYHADTGKMPYEYSGYTAKSYHQLAFHQNIAGWKGPYIDHALSKGDSPWNGQIRVYKTLNSARSGGFDLTGNAHNDVRGDGAFVRFSDTTEDTAKRVNAVLDKGIGGNWKRTGRVMFRNGKMEIFLMDPDGK